MPRKRSTTAVSRRAFMASTPIMAMAWPALTAKAEGTPQPSGPVAINRELLEHVHPQVRYRRVELPDEHNAYALWLKAGRAVDSFDDFVVRVVGERTDEEQLQLQETYDKALDEGHAFPPAEAGEMIKRWLKANEPAMELVAAGLARARLQFPERFLLNYFEELDEADDLIVVYREFARLMLLRAKLYMVEGDYQAAAEQLTGIWRLGQIVVESEGLLIHHLIGFALKSMGNEGVRDLGRDRRAPAAVIRGLKQKLRGYYPKESQFAQTLRVECSYFFLSEIDRLPEGGPLRDLVDALIKQFVLLGQTDPEKALTTRRRIRELRQGLMRLLEGHPAPLDKADTVRIYSREMAVLIGDLGTPYLKRNREIGKNIARQVEAWPKQLSLESELSLFPEDAGKREPLSEEDLQRARQALLGVKNPVGKHLAQSIQDFDHHRVVLPNHRMRMAASEVVLAVRLYIDMHRQLPETLEALVDEKLIDRMPEDPFAGKPLSYSRKKGIIWSYGWDEKDDGGDRDWEAESSTGEDVVWKLPRI